LVKNVNTPSESHVDKGFERRLWPVQGTGERPRKTRQKHQNNVVHASHHSRKSATVSYRSNNKIQASGGNAAGKCFAAMSFILSIGSGLLKVKRGRLPVPAPSVWGVSSWWAKARCFYEPAEISIESPPPTATCSRGSPTANSAAASITGSMSSRYSFRQKTISECC